MIITNHTHFSQFPVIQIRHITPEAICESSPSQLIARKKSHTALNPMRPRVCWIGCHRWVVLNRLTIETVNEGLLHWSFQSYSSETGILHLHRVECATRNIGTIPTWWEKNAMRFVVTKVTTMMSRFFELGAVDTICTARCIGHAEEQKSRASDLQHSSRESSPASSTCVIRWEAATCLHTNDRAFGSVKGH